MNWVVVATFNTRIEAELARGYLAENGIPAVIQADDAGGMRPDIAFLTGIRLQVEAPRAERARALLEAGAPETEEK